MSINSIYILTLFSLMQSDAVAVRYHLVYLVIYDIFTVVLSVNNSLTI